MVKALLEAGHTLRTLDQGTQSRENAWEHIPGDVCDLSVVRRAVQGMEAVIHTAAILGEVRGYEELLYKVNIQGTWNILIACVEAGVERLVNFSSINALGHSSPAHTALYLPLDDEVPRQPYNAYQVSKHVGEELCQSYSSRFGLDIVSLRPTFIYASGSDNLAWLKGSEDEKAAIATIDYWSFVDVRDVCSAALLSLTVPMKGHQAFLLASDYSHARMTTQELVQKYYPHLPWTKVAEEAYLKDNPYRSLIDCARARQVLGWQPEFSPRQLILGE